MNKAVSKEQAMEAYHSMCYRIEGPKRKAEDILLAFINQDVPARKSVIVGFAAFADGTFELSIENGRHRLNLTGPISKSQIAESYNVLPMCVYEEVEARDRAGVKP